MSDIVRVPVSQISPALRALFDVDQPLAIRCFGVLDGTIRGQIWTDEPVRPTCSMSCRGARGISNLSCEF